MTIYEQIQRALDHIEENLAGPVSKQEVSRDAGMSLRSFQHYFWAVTGLTYREYVVKRRLAEASRRLETPGRTILEVALDSGYQTHESLTRAFRAEFGLSPGEFRRRRPPLKIQGKIQTYQEFAMGVILKELPELRAAVFDGYGPHAEDEAHRLLEAWKGQGQRVPGRILGHNLTTEGTLSFGPDRAGYRLLATLASGADAGEAPVVILPPGKFAVTGIEGSFTDDPSGSWISEGWARMNGLVTAKGYRLKPQGRWFEEELDPRVPGNLRLDLSVELEL